MNSIGVIKFMDELETEGSILFLDAFISHKEDGIVMKQVYQKKTHIAKYLHFNSYHPLNNNMQTSGHCTTGVITLS